MPSAPTQLSLTECGFRRTDELVREKAVTQDHCRAAADADRTGPTGGASRTGGSSGDFRVPDARRTAPARAGHLSNRARGDSGRLDQAAGAGGSTESCGRDR